MWVIDNETPGLLADTRNLYGVPWIIVIGSCILDVAREPGSVSDIFSINY